MKKEIAYRVFRIILVIIFVVFFSTVRNSIKASYTEASTIIDSMPGFTVVELDNNIDKSTGLREEHTVQIKNVSHKKQDVSFVLNNTNDAFPYNYMNYTIVKNNKVVKSGLIRKDEVLYKDEIKANINNSYKIILNISQEDINALGGVSISAQILFI